MDNHPRQILCNLLRHHGRQLCHDPERCAVLLAERCPDNPGEVDALVRCLRHGSAADMLNWPQGRANTLLSGKLVRRLVDESGLSEAAATWAVESWGQALAQAADRPAGRSPAAERGVDESAEDGAEVRTRLPVPEEFLRDPHRVRVGRERGMREGTVIGFILGVLVMLLGQAAEWSPGLSLGWVLLAPVFGALVGALAGEFTGASSPELASGIAGTAVGLVGGMLLHPLMASEEISEVWHQTLITGLIGVVIGSVLGAVQRGVIVSVSRVIAAQTGNLRRSSRE